VLVSMQSDGPSASLPAPDHIPKSFVALAFVQSGIDIVRNDRQDRADAFIDQDLLELLPQRPIDRWAHIVEAH
jgi:hypothetical protein